MKQSKLFPAEFLNSLAGLHIRAQRVPAGGRHAEHNSRMRGGGVEFTDVRQYVPGDDFRAIDWHIYQRLDKVFLRLFLEDQDLPIYFLLDQSRSMSLDHGDGSSSKTIIARQAVAALSYLTLAQMDRVSIYPFADAPLRPLPKVAGKNAFHRLLAYLEELPAGGGTSFTEAVDRFSHQRLRKGLCVVVSDFFTAKGVEEVLTSLQRVPHRLLLLRPVHAKEAEPPLHGELQVVDCESNESLAVTCDADLRRRYREAYEAFGQQLAGLCKRRAAGLLNLQTDQSPVALLQSLFPQGSMVV